MQAQVVVGLPGGIGQGTTRTGQSAGPRGADSVAGVRKRRYSNRSLPLLAVAIRLARSM